MTGLTVHSPRLRARTHGGPGPAGPARYDFSTTANACGPCPAAMAALRDCDRSCYPDPSYTALKQQLAAFHGVSPERVLLAASASEFIFRITAATGLGPVAVPRHAFGDYATAARAFGRSVRTHQVGVSAPQAVDATLVWHTDPGSPLGASSVFPHAGVGHAVRVLDRACEPLRLEGVADVTEAEAVFQLWSPNKALGMTGVRAAYAIAPQTGVCSAELDRLEAMCPSWPLGAEGVALLRAWVSPEVQSWVAASHVTLRSWKTRQCDALRALGWDALPSVSNFNVVRWPGGGWGEGESERSVDVFHRRLAAAGVAWRYAESFGLPHAWRVSVQAPEAQDAMLEVLRTMAPFSGSPRP